MYDFQYKGCVAYRREALTRRLVAVNLVQKMEEAS